MKKIDVIELCNYYNSARGKFKVNSYENQLLYGIKKEIEWQKMDDLEKLNHTRIQLDVTIRHFQDITPKLVIPYEQAVIEFGFKIIEFIEQTYSLFEGLDNINEKDKDFISLFRFRNMLFCELYAINRHRKLDKGGHIGFKLVFEPIIVNLKSTKFYQQYEVESLINLYLKVLEIYNQNPYNKPNHFKID